LDAKYDRQQLRQEAIAQAEINCLCKSSIARHHLEVLRDRLASRTGDIADLLSAQQAAAEPFTQAEQPYVKNSRYHPPLESLTRQGSRGALEQGREIPAPAPAPLPPLPPGPLLPSLHVFVSSKLLPYFIL